MSGKWTRPISTTAQTAPIDRALPTFSDEPHTYRVGDQDLPSVTSIIKSILPVSYHGATEWHMNRGTIVHQCCAMICKGVRFTNDPQIDGQLTACREWLAMRQPEVVSVERIVWKAASYAPFAGTLDLLCRIGGELWIVDWKGSASKWDQWQLGGYADALEADCVRPKYGLIVELGANGKPKEGKPVRLKQAANEWRSILGVYADRDKTGQCARNVEIMMRREGLTK